MKLTSSALNSSRLTFFVALLILVSGAFAFLTFPSQEEPSVTMREGVVFVANPGLPAERLEQLVARPLEERLRQLNELKTVTSTVRAGSVLLQVSLRDDVRDLVPAWQRMRAKVDEAVPYFPAGTLPPQVDDDFGRVAIASIAITAPGFSMSEMRAPLKQLREGLLRVPGVQGVSFYGLQEERVYIEFDRARLAALGLSSASVLQQLQQQNIVQSGGQAVIAGLNSAVVASGEIRSLPELKAFLLSVPGAGKSAAAASVRLGDIAQIQVAKADPVESAAIYRGEDAVVLGVSMRSGQNIKAVGKALKARVSELERQLPAGFTIDYATFQPDVVAAEMGHMNQVMLETVVIVMIVVVLFLGWRAGVVVGSIVPLTILATLLLMRSLGIELHIVSMAAIIIALGLLVDNGIVIAEDVERRLAAGEERRHACVEAGRTLAIPLLASSLVIIFAFSPFYFGNTSTSEYLRPLVVVLTLSLLGSWLLCLTVTPLLCYHFLQTGHGHDAPSKPSRFYQAYASTIRRVLDHKGIFLAVMCTVLALALTVLGSRPAGFMPSSDRPQFQVELELQPGSDARRTQDVVRGLSRWLGDRKANPDVTTSIGYVAEGGPRVVLVLNPPLPASNIGYFTVTVADPKKMDAVMARTRLWMTEHHPDVRIDAKRFSRTSNDSGAVAYRISGSDETVLRAIGLQVEAALRSLPGLEQVKDNWGPRLARVDIEIDQNKARRLGISSEEIASALATRNSGAAVSVLRDGDTLVPLVVRASQAERTRPEDMANTLVQPAAGGAPVPLSAIATVKLGSEPSTIRRRNLERTLTVSARNAQGTAQQAVDLAAPAIARVALPPGYRIEIGGELEEAAESNATLGKYLPAAMVAMLILFIWQFGSFRKLALIVGIIPFAMIGAGPALVIAGEPLGFMANFGLLSLAGIIVNNAVLLLERIEVELAAGLPMREAVVAAAVARLRPIVMTKLTCIAGLIPLLLFAGTLWTGMAVTIMGGLLLGTLITLGLVPVLYELLFDGRIAAWAARLTGSQRQPAQQTVA
ncbi:efflux RND transporter permease subunit [Janthinobacterium sp. GW460P]|uniref:efflux RND transporter permease subunit n=1 Tax=unclassified Janthinobacterium TaxID=2610881 RepID=UPI000A3245AA|nr:MULTISPECIES: efflux RND transporter permease subunit [unclassified Janthinobacterium]MCC7706045.1 efflux RND transporter permease subunit [Janthinobacterium sp. GW460P]MCC7711547.1 efflux RND transporter permease subunit [Janthinobacterium sp. GW460W]